MNYYQHKFLDVILNFQNWMRGHPGRVHTQRISAEPVPAPEDSGKGLQGLFYEDLDMTTQQCQEWKDRNIA